MALAFPTVPKASTRVSRVLETLRLWLGGKPEAVQVAALPWRRDAEGQLLVLLATSRDTGRWVLPKGWPQKGRSLSETAAVEAWEEAGLSGRIGCDPLGSYFYRKLLDNGLRRRVRVQVFPLAVADEAQDWPEKGQRELRWFPPHEAARNVHEPELARILGNARLLEELR